AADRMREALAGASIQAPKVPVVANVLAAPVTDPEAIRRHLVEQVTGSVRWRESMIWLGANGVTRFVECGSGKVLAGLAKRAVAGAEAVSIGSADDVSGYSA
ncbi:MAG: malonyl CoA-acyl carrier protein transacylase, partial [Hyphomicrobiales bacterium]|nr:malonyl CoA-acyl carrier protein transacylase [Hyphomicrobiales bacterium]